MSYTMKFWSFQKRKNSTLQPPTNSGTVFDVVFKNPSSIKNPTITLNAETFPYTYAQFENKYYYITDVIALRNNLYEVHLKLDALATYKTQIGATSAFVVYDTTPNTELTDSRLSIKTTKQTAIAYGGENIWVGADTIMLGIVGKDSAGVFAVTENNAKALLNQLNRWLDNTNVLPMPTFPAPGSGASLDDYVELMLESLQIIGTNFQRAARQFIATGKAPDSIKSALLLPVNSSFFPGSSEDIYLAEYETRIRGKRITGFMVANESVTIDIPWIFTDWRRNSPYTEVYIYLPYAGLARIPSSNLIGVSSLFVDTKVSVDGRITYTVNGDSGKKVLVAGGNCASSYMIGASNVTPMSAVASVGAAVGATAAAIATGGAALPVIGAAGATVSAYAATNNISGLPTSIGAMGGGAYTGGEQSEVIVVCHDTIVSPDSVSAAMGTPAMAVKTIGALSGFVQTSQASVSVDTYDDIRQEINNTLDGGFFYE